MWKESGCCFKPRGLGCLVCSSRYPLPNTLSSSLSGGTPTSNMSTLKKNGFLIFLSADLPFIFLSRTHVTKFWLPRSHWVEPLGELSKGLDVSGIPFNLCAFTPPSVPGLGRRLHAWTATVTLQSWGQKSHLWTPNDMDDCLLYKLFHEKNKLFWLFKPVLLIVLLLIVLLFVCLFLVTHIKHICNLQVTNSRSSWDPAAFLPLESVRYPCNLIIT